MKQQAANAAIFFADDAYLTDRPKLMGRQSAGEGFLRGFVRHSGVDEFRCVVSTPKAAQSFAGLCRKFGAGSSRVSYALGHELHAIGDLGTLYLPGPMIAEMAWKRGRGDPSAFSLFGITHTISSHGAIDAIADMLTAPVEPWDMLVCTSRPVLQAVRRLLESEGERIARRFSGKMPLLPQLTVVPLGVDADALRPNGVERKQWRDRLSIGDDDVVFLFVGRLSFHAKANPFPMLLAVQEAQRQTGKRVHLVQAGWFANAAIEAAFRDSAAALCPDVLCHFPDGRESDVRRGIWHAADIFISLSDNIQETFGLTPIEAMASGLPSIVSDWDGYRDTVRDGVDGFRVPTRTPPPGFGTDLAVRHEEGIDNYDKYIGYGSLFVSVDIDATVKAAVLLARDKDLRTRMAGRAIERVRSDFDWAVIVRQYQELWTQMRQKRGSARSNQAIRNVSIVNPRRADPYWLFSEYPTCAVSAGDIVSKVEGIDEQETQFRLRGCSVTNFGYGSVLSAEACDAILRFLTSNKAVSVSDLAGAISENTYPAATVRTLLFLEKIGLIRIAPGNTASI